MGEKSGNQEDIGRKNTLKSTYQDTNQGRDAQT